MLQESKKKIQYIHHILKFQQHLKPILYESIQFHLYYVLEEYYILCVNKIKIQKYLMLMMKYKKFKYSKFLEQFLNLNLMIRRSKFRLNKCFLENISQIYIK